MFTAILKSDPTLKALKTRLKGYLASQAFYNADEFLAFDWESTQLPDIPWCGGGNTIGVGVGLSDWMKYMFECEIAAKRLKLHKLLVIAIKWDWVVEWNACLNVKCWMNYKNA